MKKHFKLLCALLCVLLCTSLLLSACLVMHSPEHDCLGDNCPVCQAIALQRELLKSIFLCCLFCTSAMCLKKLMTMVLMPAINAKRRKSNLVACKVKLTA